MEEVWDPLGHEGYAERVQWSTFLGETFRGLKYKASYQFGNTAPAGRCVKRESAWMENS